MTNFEPSEIPIYREQMKNHKYHLNLLIITLILSSFFGQSIICQNIDTKGNFTITKLLPHSPIKNQYKTNTCWAFTCCSLLESELLRETGKEIDLSEMWIVRKTFEDKAERYVRLHGFMSFTGGGSLSDIFRVINKYGVFPESSYSGLIGLKQNHDHFKLDTLLKEYVDSIVINYDKALVKSWKNGFIDLLNNNLGEVNEKIEYDNRIFNPLSFANDYKLNNLEYILFTSFQYQDLYKEVLLEVPDNWHCDKAWNVPMPDLTSLIDYSLEKGYTVGWTGDISERGYNFAEGTIRINEKDYDQISEELRQKAYDLYYTTDDHALHIIGKAKDKNGKDYYISKNSWGSDNTAYKGYMFIEKEYINYKTLSLLINKKAINKLIIKKLRK